MTHKEKFVIQFHFNSPGLQIINEVIDVVHGGHLFKLTIQRPTAHTVADLVNQYHPEIFANPFNNLIIQSRTRTVPMD